MMTKTKRNTLILLLVAATVIAAAAAWLMLLPSGYIALDVNPSIEIHTNRLGKVTSVEGANDDAKELLKSYRLRDRDLDDVVEDLVDLMILQGYLGKNNDASVLVTVDDGSVSDDTLSKVNDKIQSYLDYRSLSVQVLGQSVEIDDDLRKQAQEHNISAGKMSVIDRLVVGDSSLRPEDLRDTKVVDLVAYAQKKNISLDLLEDRLDQLEDRHQGPGENSAGRLEDQLDDLDDKNDDRYDDDRDDWDDHDDRYDDDRDDWDDHDDRYDDDRDDWDDHDDRYDDDRDDWDDHDDRYDDDRDDWDDFDDD